MGIFILPFLAEPLLPGNSYKENIKYLIETATKNNLDIAIVTNGYTIVEYLDIIKQGKIREIQVTQCNRTHP